MANYHTIKAQLCDNAPTENPLKAVREHRYAGTYPCGRFGRCYQHLPTLPIINKLSNINK